MKKRLLLILVIGFSFAPAVFASYTADTSQVEVSETRPENPGGSFCIAGGITRTKDISGEIVQKKEAKELISSGGAGNQSDNPTISND